MGTFLLAVDASRKTGTYRLPNLKNLAIMANSR
jgi:hypothetical protein